MSDARENAAELLDAAGLFTTDRPMATTVEIAQALDIPLYAVRGAAIDVGAQRIGHALAMTQERALDCAEELASRGYQIGHESDEQDDEESDTEE